MGNLSADFKQKDIETALKSSNCGEAITSIEDVFEFVDKLIVPFGQRYNYMNLMAADLILVILSFVASFLYLE